MDLSNNMVPGIYNTHLSLISVMTADDLVPHRHQVICNHHADKHQLVSRPILGLCPANERRCYKVTPSLIGWAQCYNQPWVSNRTFFYKIIPVFQLTKNIKYPCISSLSDSPTALQPTLPSLSFPLHQRYVNYPADIHSNPPAYYCLILSGLDSCPSVQCLARRWPEFGSLSSVSSPILAWPMSCLWSKNQSITRVSGLCALHIL